MSKEGETVKDAGKDSQEEAKARKMPARKNGLLFVRET